MSQIGSASRQQTSRTRRKTLPSDIPVHPVLQMGGNPPLRTQPGLHRSLNAPSKKDARLCPRQRDIKRKMSLLARVCP